MGTLNFKIVTTVIAVFLLAIGTQFFVSAKTKPKADLQDQSVTANSFYFEYEGTPGNEHDRSLWKNVPNDDGACDGENDGCLIEVSADYTQTHPVTGEILLSQDVPVTSGSHANPIIDNDMVLDAKYRNP